MNWQSVFQGFNWAVFGFTVGQVVRDLIDNKRTRRIMKEIFDIRFKILKLEIMWYIPNPALRREIDNTKNLDELDVVLKKNGIKTSPRFTVIKGESKSE